MYLMGMSKNAKEYIASQPLDRQEILAAIHAIIIEQDTTVAPVVEPMMRIEMIIYKNKGVMKYGLASTKNYMSLHVMPIYAFAPLHTKYKSLLPNANFQKGCINFKNESEMPLAIVQQLFADCAKIDLARIREEYLKKSKKK